MYCERAPNNGWEGFSAERQDNSQLSNARKKATTTCVMLSDVECAAPTACMIPTIYHEPDSLQHHAATLVIRSHTLPPIRDPDSMRSCSASSAFVVGTFLCTGSGRGPTDQVARAWEETDSMEGNRATSEANSCKRVCEGYTSEHD